MGMHRWWMTLAGWRQALRSCTVFVQKMDEIGLAAQMPSCPYSGASEPAGRKRSRSAAGGAVPHNAGNDSFDPIAPADEPGSRNVGRVADGIRTRDIQIHNLVP